MWKPKQKKTASLMAAGLFLAAPPSPWLKSKDICQPIIFISYERCRFNTNLLKLISYSHLVITHFSRGLCHFWLLFLSRLGLISLTSLYQCFSAASETHPSPPPTVPTRIETEIRPSMLPLNPLPHPHPLFPSLTLHPLPVPKRVPQPM